MIKHLIFSISVLALSVLVSCTSARWTIQDNGVADPSDYEIIEQKQFLTSVGTVTPEDPVLRMELRSHTVYEYAQKVLSKRNIQDYRLRPGHLALGLGGSAIAFYAANSMAVSENLSTTQSLTLNVAGGFMALSGLLNMKPVGEPRPTGEERYLRQTGTEVQVDTVSVSGPADGPATIEIVYRDSVIFQETNRAITTDQVRIPIGSELGELQLKGEEPGLVDVTVTFNDSTYRHQYPVERILQPYAQVSSQLTELRNSPQESGDNILAELLQGSEVQIQQLDKGQWFRVLYGGISGNYINQDDAEIVWRPLDFSRSDQVVTVPQIPFGDVDVESNIPVLREQNDNAYALIIANENYESKDLPQRNYARRDGRLIKSYLNTAFGYNEEHIHELTDVTSSNQIYRKLSELRFATNDSTELFVYISGYGTVERENQGIRLSVLNVQEEHDNSGDITIDLRALLEQLSTISSGQTVVVGDIDFSPQAKELGLTTDEEQQVLENYAAELENGDKQTSFFWGMHLSQPSGLYVSAKGEDKKHRIFPYYFARALQNRRTAVSSIYQYLERNVSYTSRRLHDRSQDPILMGDVFLDLINQ